MFLTVVSRITSDAITNRRQYVTMKRIMPVASIVASAIVGGVLLVTLPALAQPAAKSPLDQATEAILLEQVTQHRDWRAQAIADEEQVKALNSQIADLQRQLAAAKKAPPPKGPDAVTSPAPPTTEAPGG